MHEKEKRMVVLNSRGKTPYAIWLKSLNLKRHLVVGTSVYCEREEVWCENLVMFGPNPRLQETFGDYGRSDYL